MENKTLESVPLLKLAVCLMAGIVIGDCVSVAWLPLFVGCLVAACLLWRYAQLQSMAIAVCFIVLGGLLTARHRASLTIKWPDSEVVYEAVVLSDPVERPKTMAVDVLLLQSQRKLKCYLYKDERSWALQIGDGLRIQSRIEGHGDTGRTFVASWKWQKVRLSLKGLSRLERTRLWFLQQRSRLLHRLAAGGLSGDAYAVVAAMALGDKSALEDDVKEVYSLTGASHVLALSGLHLGIIYSLISLLVAGRRWRVVSQVALVAAVWCFVFLVGLSVSVVRAAVMLSVYALLSLGHRNKMSVNTLAFTAIVLLMVNPDALFDVGFQMSFMAVFSILIWLPLMMNVFPQPWLMSHRVVRWIWGMVSVSCAAQMGTAPLIAYYFGRFSTYFLLTNFIVIPAATLVLYLMPVVAAMPSLADLLLYIVGCLNRQLGMIASLPGASIGGLRPTVLQITMVYVVIMAVWLLAGLLQKKHHQ